VREPEGGAAWADVRKAAGEETDVGPPATAIGASRERAPWTRVQRMGRLLETYD
jgi:hypothetical protein